MQLNMKKRVWPDAPLVLEKDCKNHVHGVVICVLRIVELDCDGT